MSWPAALALVAAVAGCSRESPHPVASLPPAVVQHTLETKPTGESVRWHGPDGRQQGTMTPIRTFRTRLGYCREYVVTVTVPAGGVGETWREVACRDEAGIWRDPAIGV